MSSSAEKYLVVKGIAGLGNRMLAAITGILFARLMRRQLIVDWSDFTYSNDETNVFPLLFTCTDTDPSSEIPNTNSISPSLWRGRLNKSASVVISEVDPSAYISRRGYRRFSYDLDILDHPEDVLVMWSYTQLIRRARRHFRGEFADLAKKSDEAILSDLLRSSLMPRAEIRARIRKWKAEHFGSGPVIGVHIRFMDTKIPWLPFLKLRTSIDSFFAAIDKIKAKVPEAAIFLATDNREAQRLVEDRYRNVIATEKWFPTTGHEMHQNPECSDRLNNAVEALIDMYLLAECDYLVFPSSSTFSYISSLLANIPRARIVDVERNDPVVRIVKAARYWLS
jgi:Nodulation protein Z (NodZ)